MPIPSSTVNTTLQHNTPLLVIYGSNMGASEELAQRIAHDGEAQGYVTTVAALDDHVGQLPHEGGLVIVTSSYNGKPPANAVRFCEWLGADGFVAACQGVRYTVFGCGNRDWAATYQAIPRLIDSKLAAAGATRLYPRGEADARNDFIYQDELEALAAQGITELVTAYSRQDPAQKVYVQQRILEKQDMVWQLLEEGATIYIRGDANRMAPDVRRALGALYQAQMNADEATAEEWLRELEANRRYLLDVWAST